MSQTASMEDTASYDLVVVGSGIHGMSVAKTYLDLFPSASVRLFDTAPTPGGVWSADRLYPGLITHNCFGTYEFGELPMTADGLGDDSHIPGTVVNGYLCSYAGRFGLARLTHFNTKVERAEEMGEKGWLLTVRSASETDSPARRVHTARLVVATGLTSTPFVPSFQGSTTFNAPIFHSKDYARQADVLKGLKTITVFSGGKSAWDCAHQYASSGVQVDWVIRKSGHGPAWMAPRRVLGPFKVLAEKLVNTRFVTWQSPCIYGDADGYRMVRKFLNQTRLGLFLLRGFHFKMQAAAVAHNGYDSHPETKKLRPWNDLFWTGSNRGLLNYDTDIFQLVRDGKIRVHIADVTHLSDHTIHLSNDTQLHTEALICATGWKHSVPIEFLRDGQDITAELGLPHNSTQGVSPLIQRADAEILDKFPRLREQPSAATQLRPLEGRDKSDQPSTSLTEPYRLYRFMVPPRHVHTRTIAFAGALRSGSTTWLAQVQALWLVAFFANKLPHLSRAGDPDFDAGIEYETVLHSRFGKWRFPYGFGPYFPDFFFDALPYVDLMLGELGLKFRRKGSAFWECFESYRPEDYRGITEEWQEKQRRDEQNKEQCLLERKSRKLETADMVSQLDGLAVSLQSSLIGRNVTALIARVAGLVLLLSIVGGVLAAQSS